MATRHSLPLALVLLAGIGFLPSALADAAHHRGGTVVVHATAAQSAHAVWPAGSQAAASPRTDTPTVADVAPDGRATRVRSDQVIVAGLELYLHAPR